MHEIRCKKCGEIQWSPMDKQYARMFPQCWSCDKKEWEDGSLLLEVFEQRESRALELTVK